MVVASALFVGGLIAAAMVWQHYSREAARYDVALLPQLSHGTRVLDRDGDFVGTVFAGDRKFVKIGDVPKHLIEAVIATEDARFYSHGGVDIRGIARAAWVNLRGLSVRQGASTITQQLARQAFDLRGRTLDRKLTESFIAMRLEKLYTKEQILEYYLNQIYLGSGFNGVGSAARGYFGKDVAALTPDESAMLAGIIKAPVSYSPYRSPDQAKRVRNLTLERMALLGFIDAAQAETLEAMPIKVLSETSRRERPDYLIAALERELESQHRQTGYETLRVTVRGSLQSKCAQLLASHIDKVEEAFPRAKDDQGAALQGAVLVIDNATGGILASIGGRDYRTSPFDRALQGQRPAGTAFLPLAYAGLISVNRAVATAWVLDGPLDNRRAMVGSMEGILGEWGNETGPRVFEGHVSAAYALLKGKTGAAVRLGYWAGLDPARIRLQYSFESPLREQSSILLGASSVRLLDMARAYSALANDGKIWEKPNLAVAFQTKDGHETSAAPAARNFMAFDTAAAQWVRAVLIAELQQPAYSEILKKSGLSDAGLAGYGGTAYGFTDAWFAGFDRNVTCVVWLGYDETRTIGKDAWAKDIAFPLWTAIMAEATRGSPAGWPVSHSSAQDLICVRSGGQAGPACLTAGDTIRMPRFNGMKEVVTPWCMYHQGSDADFGAPAGVAEVFPSPQPPKTRIAAAARARTIAPTSPPVVGADVYGAVSTSRDSRREPAR